MTNPCIETVKHTSIVFTEAKSKFEIKNPNQREIERHKVDNGIFKNRIDIKKCDWLAIDVLSKREIYIELKGQDADSEAIEQISNTVKLLTKDKNAFKLGFIVHTSSMNPETDTTMQRMVKRLKQTHNIMIYFRRTPHKETIEDLISK